MKFGLSPALALGVFALALISCSADPHQIHRGRSDLRSTPAHEGFRAFDPNRDDPGGFNELLPFVFASPNQDDAGSCLYMSLTGIAEWWLARLNPTLSREPDGPLDLSERYMMNLAGMNEDDNKIVPNWKTDSIFYLNVYHQSALNSAYRYTKGWYVEDEDGDLSPATEKSPGAKYDTKYNWIDERRKITHGYVTTPHFERDVIFADPASNQWNVGVAPDDIVEKVKEALTNNKAPVHVIYNEEGFWHAVVIVGFNDDLPNDECPFVKSSISLMRTEPQKIREEAQKEQNADKRAALLARARRYEATFTKLNDAYERKGGCHGSKGVFYVRDSLYGDENGPVYDYDLSRQGDEAPYSKKVILREYDWLYYLGNHVVQIMVKN